MFFFRSSIFYWQRGAGALLKMLACCPSEPHLLHSFLNGGEGCRSWLFRAAGDEDGWGSKGMRLDRDMVLGVLALSPNLCLELIWKICQVLCCSISNQKSELCINLKDCIIKYIFLFIP
ncbi:hypothetical protein J4Q44_G00284930, partial [Coregonus suidteri]